MAIARDAATNGGRADLVTSMTYSHTCSGSNRMLFVGVMTLEDGDVITGVTYAGVSMTQLSKKQISGGNWIYVYYLIAPATGANNVVVSSSSSDYIYSGCASYTGVAQTGFPDSSAIINGATGTSYSMSTTSVADNCWAITLVRCNTTNHSNLSDGTGTTRVTLIADALEFADNQVAAPKTPAGTITLIKTDPSSETWGGAIIASFAPAPTTSIKTIDGLAYSSVKTINGLAVSSVKTIDGLA